MPDIRPPIDHQALEEFWEKVDLLAYLAIIVVVTPAVTQLLGAAWEAGGIAQTTVFALERALGISHLRFFIFCLGAYFGLVTLLLLDGMKRVQGVLLTIASAIALSVFKTQGLVFPLYPLENLDLLAAGFVGAAVYGGALKLRRSEPPYEFRRATATLFWVVTAFVGVSVVERNLIYENPLALRPSGGLQAVPVTAQVAIAGNQLFTDLVTASIFVMGAYLFTNYEARTNVAVVGIQRAGKTLLAVALLNAADGETETRLNPSGPLSTLYTRLKAAEDDWTDGGYIGPTKKGEYHLLEFQTQAGELFRKYVKIGVLDYAGEYINDKLVSTVAERVPKTYLSVNWLRFKYEQVRGLPDLPEKADGLESERVRTVLAQQTIHSDTLVLVVDSGSLVPTVPYGSHDYELQQDRSDYLDTYSQLLRHLDESVLAEKKIVLVATKADYLYQLYRNTDTSLSFFNWVNFHLLESEEGQEKLGPLLNQAQVETVYPVYYELDHEASLESGEPIPDRPITVRGNEPLLTRLKGGT